jgi:hypothetical protein
MAGVASPMLRSSRARGVRFLAGLAIGGAAGGMLLALPVYLLGTLAGHLPLPMRAGSLALACAGLGVADLLGRTPHVWRQVPQSLVRTLEPGALGLAWGFDLGLLFTTQKTTSLIWGCLAAVVLLRPDLAVPVLVGISVVASMSIAGLSIGGLEPEARRSRRWIRSARRGSGLVMFAALLAAVLG